MTYPIQIVKEGENFAEREGETVGRADTAEQALEIIRAFWPGRVHRAEVEDNGAEMEICVYVAAD